MLADKNKDIYTGILYNDKIIAYGLLRGFNEGYDIPSLGAAIDKDFLKRGIFYMYMKYLHCYARVLGAKKMRLTVYKENKIAHKVYENMGYEFEELNKKELIGFKNI